MARLNRDYSLRLGRLLDAVASQFFPTEKAMVCAMADEEGQKWPQRRCQQPNSTEGTPNGQIRLRDNIIFESGGALHVGAPAVIENTRLEADYVFIEGQVTGTATCTQGT